jgi:hypothetical protein
VDRVEELVEQTQRLPVVLVGLVPNRPPVPVAEQVADEPPGNVQHVRYLHLELLGETADVRGRVAASQGEQRDIDPSQPMGRLMRISR